MDNILRFMMMLISLAFLMFLKNTVFAEKRGEVKLNTNISPEHKLAI